MQAQNQEKTIESGLTHGGFPVLYKVFKVGPKSWRTQASCAGDAGPIQEFETRRQALEAIGFGPVGLCSQEIARIFEGHKIRPIVAGPDAECELDRPHMRHVRVSDDVEDGWFRPHQLLMVLRRLLPIPITGSDESDAELYAQFWSAISVAEVVRR